MKGNQNDEKRTKRGCDMLLWIMLGGLIPPMLLGCGLFFIGYLRGAPMRYPRRMLDALRHTGTRTGVSPFRALTLALAGTLGVGNIVGVASALWIGGAGAIFWMWISALVAMVLKYAEIILAVAHRREGRQGSQYGGACYYIKDHFLEKRRWKTAALLSSAFAVLMILNALSMGCILQVNAVSAASQGVIGCSPWICALILTVFTVPLLCKGTDGIAALTEWMVPIMSGGFLVLSIAVMILRADAVGDAFLSIFREAFSKDSMAGGVLGFLTSKALRMGTMRGLLSNEAGCGTAPTAHAAAETESPAAQGVWGVVEVFVDTILLCTVTALVILVSFDEVSMLGENPVMMAIRAYTCVLGDFASYFFCAAIFFFGLATVLCWASYGMENVRFLSRRKTWKALYLLLFVICIWIGSFCAPNSVWALADFAIAALTTINLSMLLCMRREIRSESERWFCNKG